MFPFNPLATHEVAKRKTEFFSCGSALVASMFESSSFPEPAEAVGKVPIYLKKLLWNTEGTCKPPVDLF